MGRSYDEINYSLRPAKHIERRMLCEIFRKMSAFQDLAEYRYVGMGSVYFSDFSLIHRELGLTNLLSIEKDSDRQERFKFNRPYKCIELQFEQSGDALAALDWDDRTICWLDYDGQLDESIIADIGMFASNACSGSLLTVSVNCHYVGGDQSRVKTLKDAIGSDYIPNGIEEKQLSGWSASETVRKIMTDVIRNKLGSRNGGLDEFERISWHPCVNFQYQDGARMMTFGGVFVKSTELTQIQQWGVDSLEFSRTSGEEPPYKIEVPKLTFRELRHLDQQLPTEDLSQLVCSGVSMKTLKIYQQIYRYFPNFAEMQI